MKSRRIFLLLAALSLLAAAAWSQTATTATIKNEAEIKAVYDRWAKAFEAHDIEGIMSIYAPGDAVIAYDVVPPLQYKGKDAYRKDYLEFLGQYDGPIHVEYRDMRILSSGDLGFIHALEHFTGKLKNGQQSDLWLRATSGLRKIDEKWLIVHDHVSVPIDFESGKAVLDLKP
ncbi:MAG TPA: SgcJ/EcaC family oxidoreductase [Terriglobales bacterium]|nr:SgcJ/EcaC family oxidoreductase [Terriglobales bacterium]